MCTFMIGFADKERDAVCAVAGRAHVETQRLPSTTLVDGIANALERREQLAKPK